ncbi:MAG: hypothetical protein IBX69_13120 [Anaerolineales bacterium]|nr:hypothetical protein [Anaerolineales bacterium]
MAIRYVDTELGARALGMELGERTGLRPKLFRLEDGSGYWAFKSDEIIAVGFGHPPIGVLTLNERDLELDLAT